MARYPVAGLAPIEGVDRLENMDVSLDLKGHLGYRNAMPRLLRRLGVPVMAEEFTEPETAEERSEREAREDEEAELRMRLRRESMAKERELRRLMAELKAQGCEVRDVGGEHGELGILGPLSEAGEGTDAPSSFSPSSHPSSSSPSVTSDGSSGKENGKADR